jgi:N4-gp56 family major capsid protein
MAMTEYGDISPRTAAFAAVELLKRGLPYLCLEKFGQSITLPAKHSKSMVFRRYNTLAVATTALTEGVTPPSKKLNKTDVTAVLYQYGDIVEISDIIMDTHEDPTFQQAQDLIAEQAAKTIEVIRYDILKAGSNVFYANSVASRTLTLAVLARADQRRVVRALERQEASHITRVVRSTPNFNTENVQGCFVGLCHVDLKSDIRGLTGFIDAKDYGTLTPWDTEVGSCEDVRYLTSTIFVSYPDAGSTTTGKITTAGTGCDVYPVMYIARDAYGIIALKGEFAITPMVMNPGTPSKSDPLGQRGFVSWKSMQTAVILNDAWFAILEVAATL